jgi:aryl-alcohol dehydrogenase-like predicted oxidoreductase
VAESKRATPAQIALAWLLHQGDDVVPIPGTKRRRTLEENLASTGISLDADNLATLNGSLTRTAGTRYPEAAMQMNGR